ncbi:MAG: extracellular solute-binding protein, partial [Candidatus Pacebacteria bacterium]|nr:extracellular solute-binding protein [Candidatus Paceibacterota bacterium]
MNTPLPKPTDPNSANKSVGPGSSPMPANPVMPDPAKIGRSVAPAGVPKMDGVNPNLAPKLDQSPSPPSLKTDAPPNLGQAAPTINIPQVKNPVANPPAPVVGGSSTSSKPPAGQAPPQMAKAKDPKKMILIIALTLIGLGVVGSLLANVFGGSKTTSVNTASNNSANSNNTQQVKQPTEQTILTYWGLWEPNGVLDEVIQEYQNKNPGIKIDYRVQSHKDYRERLQTAIASGNGPDIFRYHASWVPMLGTDLAVLPASVMSATEFKESFYPSASQMLQIDGKIVGLPMMYEGLGLYYNKD